MTEKIEERRSALRKRLVDIAEARVTEGGVSAVRARDLAKTAECALGAIYNVFDDLQDIVLAVNDRTFQRLGRTVQQGLQDSKDGTPTNRLITIARAYLDFATDNPNAWHALFEVPISPGNDVPQWYWDELDGLFSFISGPVRECFPDMEDAEAALMTRALFSSVHGIILLGLENRVAPVPRNELMHMITLIVSRTTGNE